VEPIQLYFWVTAKSYGNPGVGRPAFGKFGGIANLTDFVSSVGSCEKRAATGST